MACGPENATSGRPLGWQPPGRLAACGALMERRQCGHDFWSARGTADYHLCSRYVESCEWRGEFSLELFEEQRKLRFVMYGVLLHAVCLVGFVGNTLTLAVLGRREFARSSSTVYLKVMMAIDTVYLAANYLHFALVTGVEVAPWGLSPLPAYSRVYAAYLASDFARNAGALLTVAVTVERYIYIRHSMHANKFCTARRARITSALLLVAIAVYEVPRALVFRVRTVPQTNGDASAAAAAWQQNAPKPCALAAAPLYLAESDHSLVGAAADSALTYFGTIVFMLLPVAALTFMTLLLLRTIARSNTKRRRLSTAAPPKSVDLNLNAVLLSVVITFVACSAPMLLVSLLRESEDMGRFFATTTAGLLLYYASVLALNVNAAVNALLFCAFGRKFRAQFKNVFLCRGAADEARQRKSSLTLHSYVSVSTSAPPPRASAARRDGDDSPEQRRAQPKDDRLLRSSLSANEKNAAASPRQSLIIQERVEPGNGDKLIAL